MNESGPTINDLGFEKYAKETNLDLAMHPVERIGRVLEEHRTRWILQSNDGQLDASIRGALHYDLDTEAFPKVGDWVSYSPLSNKKAIIETILPRSSVIRRKSIHGTGMQVVVTNIDTVAIVQGADQDFNIPKLTRYLQLVEQSGATPVIIFTKVDITTDIESYTSAVRELAPEVPVVAISAKTGTGMENLAAYLKPRETIVLLGSSGAGKSTLLNALMKKEIQETQEVREEDGKGRHTTTKRSLFMLPGGALLIDTPGMRELSIAETGEEKKKDTFDDVVEISYNCKFPNCDHDKSSGCAVLEALTDGRLEESRYKAFMKFITEKKKAEEIKYEDKNKHSDRVKSNRAALNYESRRQSEEEG